MCQCCEQLSDAKARSEEEVARLNEENARLRHRIALLEKALFGPHSERLVGDSPEHPGQQVFQELLSELQDLNAQLDELPEPPKPAPKSPRRKRSPRNLEELVADADLPREIVEVEPPGEERVDPETGAPLRRIEGHRTVRLAYTPGSYRLIEYHYPKYVNPARPLAGVVQAPARNSAVLGGSYDESFMAKVVCDKCVMHLPLYRQEEQMRHLKINVSRQTLSRLYIQAAQVLLPLWLLMKEKIIRGDVIFTDDTPVELLERGKGRTVKGRMWVYVGGGTGPPYRLFEFTVDRSKERPKTFLAGFSGYIHADAYQGYDDLFEQDGIVECACWMHVRRKYIEAVDAPADLRGEVLRAIRHLYMYERFVRTAGGELTEQERSDLVLWVRGEKTAPLIDRLFERTRNALRDREILPGSDFEKAVAYMHNLGDALKTFTTDPRLHPDNGESERAIRPLAIGRKNWLFAGCKEGGDATGILLSLTQTCRHLGVDPFQYIQDVLRRISDHPAHRLDELLPDRWHPGS